VIASIPRGADPDTISLDEALPLLAAQREKGKAGRPKSSKTRSTKATVKKAASNGGTPARAAKKTRTTKKKGSASSVKKPRTRTGAQPG
jgi:DNA topoisomerase I